MQMVENARVVVYLITGFLESGKTQFLTQTLSQEYFEIEGTTVLILCEEGIEEYDEELLKAEKYGTADGGGSGRTDTGVAAGN